MRVGAQHDGVHPALQVVRHVRERLALAERRLRLVDEDGIAAERVDGGLKGEPRAQRRLLEEHHHLLGVERMAEVRRMLLHRVGELHHGGHLLHGEVGDGAEVAAGHAVGGLVEGCVGLDAERGGFEVRFRIHNKRFASHWRVLLPALLRRPVLRISKCRPVHCTAMFTCLRSRM